jgi:exosortase
MDSDPGRATGMRDQLWNMRVTPRKLYFVLMVLGSIAVFWRSLVFLYSTAFSNDEYSHTLLILPLVIALLYLERTKVFGWTKYFFLAGFLLLLFVATFVWFVRHPLSLSPNDTLSLHIAFFASWLVLAFVFCFGTEASWAAAFPLLFLFLMVPIPDFVLERFIWLLQKCSTDVTYLMMKASHVPVMRREFILSLPGFDIEVARECSSVRSSLLLLVVTLVLAHLFLRPGWRQLLLVLLAFPISVAKNSLRIFTIATLGVYVDPSVLTGNIHRHGGVLFFLLTLVAVISIVRWLRKSEKKTRNSQQNSLGPNRVPFR